MVEVRMCQSDRLQCQTASVECLDNPFSLVSRIDTDRLFGFLAADYASVLLERSDSDFFDDHVPCIILNTMPITTQSAPLAAVLDSMTTEGAPELTELLENDALKCYACGHRCL